MGPREGVSPSPVRKGLGSAPLQNFFFQMHFDAFVRTDFTSQSKLVSRSQLRWPRHEEQRQGNVRSNNEAITGEAMSSQGLKSTTFPVSAINST